MEPTELRSVDLETDQSNQYSSLKRLSGFSLRFAQLIAVTMSIWHLLVLSGLYQMTSVKLYCGHLAFALILVFLAYPFAKKRSRPDRISFVEFILGLLGIATCLYVVILYNDFIFRIDSDPWMLDLIVGGIMGVLILECTRRAIGLALPIVCLGFTIYALVGNHLPGMLQHSGYSLKEIIQQVFTEQGIFGLPTGISARYVFFFILFGTILERSGGGRFFIDLATGLFGATRGGPAKVATMASAMFGTISGAAVANVITTGTFTIPMMKNIGYRSNFAAAVESVASSGGQLAPPIMGAGAFVMAELVGVPYIYVCMVALFPAFLYFYSVFLMVDLEAAKSGLRKLPRSELPNVKRLLAQDFLFLVPVMALLFFLVILKKSPVMAGFWAILSTIIIAGWRTRNLQHDVPFIVATFAIIWVLELAGIHSSFTGFLMVGGALLATWWRKGSCMRLEQIFEAFAAGAIKAVQLAVICACAGMIIGLIGMTGIALKVGTIIVELGGMHFLLSLILAMVVSIILGMGLPTTAAYLICAAVVAPSLVDMGAQVGVPKIAVHLFIFYFGVIANITPPVAIAAYVAAGMARAKPIEVGFNAMKLGITAFIVPYMFIYGPTLLLMGSPVKIFWSLITSLTGVSAIALGINGWLLGKRIGFIQQALLLVGAGFLIKTGWMTDFLGFLLLAMSLFMRWKMEEENLIRGEHS